MNIETRDLLRFLKTQQDIFNVLPLMSDFQKGVIEGLNLVKNFVLVYEEKEGKEIAKAAGEKEYLYDRDAKDIQRENEEG